MCHQVSDIWDSYKIMFISKIVALLPVFLVWLLSSGFTYSNGKEIIWEKEIPITEENIQTYIDKSLLPTPIKAPLWAINSVKITEDYFKSSKFTDNVVPPTIAIIIDDMGVNKFWSRKAEKLPSSVTLSYLPYAEELPKYTKLAKATGHELMLHMPMEADSISANPGPFALKTEYSKDELLKNIKYNLEQFDGYIGINNHMGSKMSQDSKGLALLMQELKKRELLYLDSRTTPISLGEAIARRYELPTTHRDIFLDHVATESFVKNSLKKLERVALKNGTAIAIGHPKQVTIETLKKWIPDAINRGFRIVPVSEIIKLRMYDEEKSKQLLVSTKNKLPKSVR